MKYCAIDDELDMEPYVIEGYKGHTKYKLHGVATHKGNSTTSGQNQAFVRPDPKGSWFKFNDKEITKVESSYFLGED